MARPQGLRHVGDLVEVVASSMHAFPQLIDPIVGLSLEQCGQLARTLTGDEHAAAGE